MTPDPVVITGEICGTILGLALIVAAFVLLMKRLKLTKLSAAQQDADRKQPEPPEPDGAEPTDLVPAAGRELLGMRPVEPLERAS
jgi:hypothetical protein